MSEKSSEVKSSEGEIELYKIAIEGYQQHWEHYTRWMNHYAIFNGALFVGLYRIMDTNDAPFLLEFIIIALGCVSSWFWLFSARGFYRWMISWINVVKKQEKVVRGKTENEKDSALIYRAFIKDNAKHFKSRPFSTQKLTQWFVGCVAISWSLILIAAIISNFFQSAFTFFENLVCVIISILLVILIVYCGVSKCRETDLKNTHALFKQGNDKDSFEKVE